ncbi:Fructosamine kinase-domain-containing protein [Xylariaceae sp. FL0016]|nr:Fructosamine kinase-domain-containing protein [Xylariaceae sp. FL0016]
MDNSTGWIDQSYPGFPKSHDKVDTSVKACLPPDCEVVRLARFDWSPWSYTARLVVRLADGEIQSFFVKSTPGEHGRDMSEAEFVSMSYLYAVQSNFVLRPIAWGAYESIPDMHFVLIEFREMIDVLPDKGVLGSRLAQLHERSASMSIKQYGFHVQTWSGTMPRVNKWCTTWEEHFTNDLKIRLEKEAAVHRTDLGMNELSGRLLAKVVPRLLRPLEVMKSIKPVLLHGDLWDKNIAIDAKTGKPVIFGAGCTWGHNEYDIGQWRAQRNAFTQGHVDAYLRHYPPAAPEDDFDDRAVLYGITHDLNASFGHAPNTQYRKLVKASMKYLAEKYSGGFEQWRASNPGINCQL